MSTLLSFFLGLHVAGGTIALVAGAFAIFSAKGGRLHRKAGRIYWWAMTAVFVGAIVLSVARPHYFLLMVAVFSYYMTVRGYRILLHKKGHRPTALDWGITALAGVFHGGLVVLGVGWLRTSSMGIAALVFGAIGLALVAADVRKFSTTPADRMHWWYGHIASMGGSYISAFTAFVVVNVQWEALPWVPWVAPTAVGSLAIARSIRFYKRKFAAPIY